jgi:nickel-type superoxide dismutase maturation protease
MTAAVSGDSMAPAYRDGDFVLVWRTKRVRVGDVVAAHDPRQPTRVVVKRVAIQAGGRLWLLGDNAVASTDSRTFGAVSLDAVVGRVLMRYYPFTR